MKLSVLWNEGATSYRGEPIFARSCKAVPHDCESLFYCDKCRKFLIEEGLQHFNNGFICENCKGEAVVAPYPSKLNNSFVRYICSIGCQKCPVCVKTYLEFTEVTAKPRSGGRRDLAASTIDGEGLRVDDDNGDDKTEYHNIKPSSPSGGHRMRVYYQCPECHWISEKIVANSKGILHELARYEFPDIAKKMRLPMDRIFIERIINYHSAVADPIGTSMNVMNRMAIGRTEYWKEKKLERNDKIELFNCTDYDLWKEFEYSNGSLPNVVQPWGEPPYDGLRYESINHMNTNTMTDKKLEGISMAHQRIRSRIYYVILNCDRNG